MNFIIDFYNGLETLDLIIFWGIIIVIILLLIFSFILINKNKKLKKFIVNNDKNKNEDTYNQEIPIKKTISTQNELINNNQHLNNQNNNNQEENIPSKLSENYKIIDNTEQSNNNNHIELEKNFIAEEHIMELNKELSNNMEEKIFEKKPENTIKHNHQLEMPTEPYQRNVLREMSLSQTSPIGLTSPRIKNEKTIELAKDLDESLNIDNTEKIVVNEENNQQIRNKHSQENDKPEEYQTIKEISKKEKKDASLIQQEQRVYQEKNENKIIKEELGMVNNYSPRKTEIIGTKNDDDLNKYEKNIKEHQMTDKPKQENINKLSKTHLEQQQILYNSESISNDVYSSIQEEKNARQQEPNKIKNENSRKRINEINIERIKDNIDPRARELLDSISKPIEIEKVKSSSEKYLEEVSRKLAEAEITDEIERTNYELEQEENAIISYKELMEKKDSIQTIDEEEAIISIEELMHRSQQKEEINQTKEDNKLYNLNEEEENDDFIKELKQFRNDL